MVICSVKSCKNQSDRVCREKVHFYIFPKDQNIAEKWLEVCKVSTTNLKNRKFSINFFCFRHVFVEFNIDLRKKN